MAEDSNEHLGSSDCSSAYIPSVGDSVAARRKEKSRIYHNLIVGPVVEVWDNACLVAFKAANGDLVEWRLYFDDWSFQFLHPSSEATDEACEKRESEILERMRRLKTSRTPSDYHFGIKWPNNSSF